MGTCPVIFVPSHRSYADFIIFSYMCFTEDVAIPAIAAGMGKKHKTHFKINIHLWQIFTECGAWGLF